ncbi:MarR family winged helix-turn-helix transcriptional regulator [Chitinolyticbacter albus]|uniref:MarR family winged helix-turn-helix transcriptional regulator n=1 Tax=Chitinolyticbacter albus TaxID=2961951 RepID=UPI00210B6543|nr:MarR family transcriptional regulator [Chitinolyticbacter albus]
MSQAPFLPVLRELACCYQAFERLSGHHIRQVGLTPGQFDVIATLGNTCGMSCRELGERTLITKGTLTGVLDRLVERGLIRRETTPGDRRSLTVTLTDAGRSVFEDVFSPHVAYLEPAFAQLSATELSTIEASLKQLRSVMEQGFGDCCEKLNN